MPKIGTGSTVPGKTAWQVHSSAGIYVDVDTSNAGFATVPNYIASVGGHSHWTTTGGCCIYSPKKDGFRIYLRYSGGGSISPATANKNLWHINWIGMEA